MEQEALLNLLENILGKGNKTSKGNYKFVCPFHISNPPGKKKLELNLNTNDKRENPFKCWACGARGKTIHSLIHQLKLDPNKYKELKYIIQPSDIKYEKNNNDIQLPEEYISLNTVPKPKYNKILHNHAINFLKQRGLNQNDIIKYNIGVCYEGRSEKRIIIPSYDENGKLNYYSARDFTDTLSEKYLNPPMDRDNIIGLELYINWNAPIILVEGIFDALTIKRNVIPLFGKEIGNGLMKKLVTSQVNKIYIGLDKDAIKESLRYCEELINMGKEVYLIELDDKDINEAGFDKWLEIIEKTQPFTFTDLLYKKMELC